MIVLFKHFYNRLTPTKLFLLAGILFIPALFAGFVTDDLYQQSLIQGVSPITPPENASILGMFSLFQSNTAHFYSLMMQGVLPWWTDEQFTLNLWRPVAELTHLLDHTIAPNNSYLAHAQSIFWYFLLSFVCFKLYQRLSTRANQTPTGPAAAFLALCIFLLDSTHGPTVAWIANRNAIIASTFAVSALLLHVISVEQEAIKYRFLAPILLAIGLLAGEYAIAIGTYFFAYAVFKDPAGPIRGFVRILPYLGIAIGWLALYKSLGFGASGSYNVQYIDPIAYPVEFLSHAITRVPALLFSQLGILPAELYNIAGFADARFSWLYAAIGLSFVIWVLRRCYLASQCKKTTLFWITAMVLSAIPVSSTVPFDRTLLLTGVAASALLAEFLVNSEIFARSADTKSKRSRLANAMFAMHLILAPILLPLTLYAAKLQGEYVINEARSLPITQDKKDYVVISGAITSTQFVNFTRSLYSDPLAGSIVLLANHLQPSTVKRLDASTLEVTQENGFIFKTDNIYRDTKRNPFSIGDQIELPHLLIRVTDVTPDGRPLTITVRSAVSWNSNQIQVLIQEAGKFNPFELPEAGNSISIE